MYGHKPIITNSIFQDTPGATYREYIKIFKKKTLKNEKDYRSREQ